MRTRYALLLMSLAMACLPPAHAQDPAKYPTRPVRMVVPYPAGGSLDMVARLMGEKLAASLGQPFIVENRAGASTIIGTDAVVKAAPDGYTLLWGAAPIALNAAIGMKLPYDARRDLAPISFVASMTMLYLVNPKSHYTSMKQVIDEAGKDQFFFASAGKGSIGHLINAYLNQTTSSKFTVVPYRGSTQALQDVLAGNIPFMIDGYIPSGIHVNTGELRALAVTTEKRSPLLPDVPTMAELGYPGATASADFGLLAPKGTPPDIVSKLNRAVKAALDLPEVRERLVSMGYEIHASSPEEYAQHIKSETDRWTKVVSAAGGEFTR